MTQRRCDGKEHQAALTLLPYGPPYYYDPQHHHTHYMNNGVQRWESFEGAGTRLLPFISWTLSNFSPLLLLETKNGHDFCVSIAKKINSESEFPVECMQYSDVVSLFKMQSNSNPYAGMSPAEAIDAKRAKSEGHLNSAQIKRRMTTRKNGRFF